MFDSWFVCTVLMSALNILKFVFLWVCLPVTASSCEVVFLGCLPVKSSICKFVFLESSWGQITFSVRWWGGWFGVGAAPTHLTDGGCWVGAKYHVKLPTWTEFGKKEDNKTNLKFEMSSKVQITFKIKKRLLAKTLPVNNSLSNGNVK